MLDLGHTEATLIPVYEGVLILKTWQAQPLAGKAVQKNLREMLMMRATNKMKGGIETKLKKLEGDKKHPHINTSL